MCSNLACVIDESSRGVKLKRAFEELPKEHGEEPSSTLQEDLNDSEDNPAYFVEQIEISRCDSIHLYFINLLSDKLDRYPERYKCVEDLFDLSDSYNLLSNFNQFYFFLTKKDIEEVLESISFDLRKLFKSPL